MYIISFLTVGRRGDLITLESILEFATSADEEPLLGFELAPSIVFTDSLGPKAFHPMANTCISRMTMPRPSDLVKMPEEKDLFEMYDMAFSNTFYGLK